MSSYIRDVKAKLSEYECYFKRQADGDHEFWFSLITGISFPVDGKILSRHTANAIMKQAGIPHRF